MRVKFEFECPDGNMRLPVNYNYYLQSMIYSNISQKLSDFLHGRGFAFEKRQFRMFTFSKIFGKYSMRKNGADKTDIVFSSPIYFYISSPFEQILQEFANKTVSGSTAILNGNRLFITSVQVLLPPVFKDRVTSIKTLSPITVHSTLEKGDGSKKSYYYCPKEKEFSELVRQNLLKKYFSFMGRYPEKSDLNIKPLHFSERRNLHIMMYKDTVVKGYSGIYHLEGDNELKQFAYDAGLGERNAQGFGMFELWKENHENSL